MEADMVSIQYGAEDKFTDDKKPAGEHPSKYEAVAGEAPVKACGGASSSGGVVWMEDGSADDCPPEYSVRDPLTADGRDSCRADDPWALSSDSCDEGLAFNDLDVGGKVRRVLLDWLGKVLCVLLLLYLFIVSLNLLSQAFRLLGGKTAGGVMSDHELLKNPVSGLMIGILATVLVQSSSTSSSIVVTMVASGMIDVAPAIPIVMGANIGTSITNTVVSLAQYSNRNEFRRAFGAATVHDMFNWLSVCILLPIEVAFGYLYKLSGLIVQSLQLTTYKTAKKDLLKVITKPITKLIVQLDKDVIIGIATGQHGCANKRLLKIWCKFSKTVILQNLTSLPNSSLSVNGTVVLEQQNISQVGTEKCFSLMSYFALNDTISGVLLLLISLFILCLCLMSMVRILHAMFKGPLASTLKKSINSDLPYPFSCLTGYLAIIIGAGMTMLLQSSSIFTSTLTPLVGMGMISINRMFPLTLGSNIGTTATGILAALASSGEKLSAALQIGLCHLMFNVTGILIFYPVPFMRKIPIGMAKKLGNITAIYRWFAMLYVITAFFLLPALVFGLSMAGHLVVVITLGTLLPILLLIIVINIMQMKCPQYLPKILKNWNFLPDFMHSFEPLDKCMQKLTNIMKNCCPCCKSCLDSSAQCDNVALPTDDLVYRHINNSPASSRPSDMDVSPSSSRSTTELIQRTTQV